MRWGKPYEFSWCSQNSAHWIKIFCDFVVRSIRLASSQSCRVFKLFVQLRPSKQPLYFSFSMPHTYIHIHVRTRNEKVWKVRPTLKMYEHMEKIFILMIMDFIFGPSHRYHQCNKTNDSYVSGWMIYIIYEWLWKTKWKKRRRKHWKSLSEREKHNRHHLKNGATE